MACKQRLCLCCCLPLEVLLAVLARLQMIDCLAFRTVCKCWQTCFSACSPPVSLKRLPWFLLSEAKTVSEEEGVVGKPSKSRRAFQTSGKFGDLSTQRIYNPNIPELSGTEILLSRHGWLLLLLSRPSGDGEPSNCSMFFFNPFSRARIDVPLIDLSEMYCSPVFDISAPPTSPDCMLFAIGHDPEERRFRTSTCRRGESKWTTSAYLTHREDDTSVVNTVFVSGVWYCFHECGRFSVFDSAERRWRFLGFPESVTRPYEAVSGHVSYVMRKTGGDDDRVLLRVHGFGLPFVEVSLEEPVKVTKQYTRTASDGAPTNYFCQTSPQAMATEQLQEGLRFDSFNIKGWCAVLCCNTDENAAETAVFRWHRCKTCRLPPPRYGNCSQCSSKTAAVKACMEERPRCKSLVVWIDPAWTNPSDHLSWML